MQAGAAPHPDAVEAATVFCHAGHDAGSNTPVLPHHAHVAAALQAGLMAAHPLALQAAPPALPTPPAWDGMEHSRPQARAPPGFVLASAYARGPPRPV